MIIQNIKEIFSVPNFIEVRDFGQSSVQIKVNKDLGVAYGYGGYKIERFGTVGRPCTTITAFEIEKRQPSKVIQELYYLIKKEYLTDEEVGRVLTEKRFIVREED